MNSSEAAGKLITVIGWLACLMLMNGVYLLELVEFTSERVRARDYRFRDRWRNRIWLAAGRPKLEQWRITN